MQRTPQDRNLPQGELLSRSNSFFAVKGPGPLKKSFKKCGNVENLKAYRLIPPMTPLLNGWTIPLIKSNANYRHLTIFSGKGILRQVFFCQRPPPFLCLGGLAIF